MGRSPRPALILAAALAIAGTSYLLAALSPAAPLPAPTEVAIAPPGADVEPLQPLAEVDRAIGVWTANLERNHADFIAATQLAELYLGRSRLTAEPGDLDRALEASSRALEANPGLLAATLLDVQVRLARHDFASAEAGAALILDGNPGLAPALATLGDAQLELGRYDAARKTYVSLAASTAGPAITARLARLASVTGELHEGRRLATEALAQAVGQPGIRPSELAWYHTLAASLAFQAGDLMAAAGAYDAALAAWPASPGALAGLARTRAAQGDLEAAIGLFERSVAVVPDPATLASLGDALALVGRHDEASAAYAQVRAIGQLAGAAGLYDRQLALFLANHGEDTGRAVEIAVADLERRPDVFAHDAYAWTLYAAGRYEEADLAMRRATATGTEEALLDYHAGMIAAALGRDEEARELLRSALDRNPGFDPLQARLAEAALAALDPAE